MIRPPPSETDSLLRAATEPGTPARLYLEEGGQGFSTNVLGVDDGRLVVAPVRPAHGNLVLERLMGAVRVEFMIAGLPHAANATVRAVTSSGVFLTLPAELERIQRRRYFRVRVPTGLNARLHLEEGVRVREVIDVSGGGCALLAQPEDLDLLDGARVANLQLPLGEGRAFTGSAVVRRSARRDGPWGREAVLGVEFLEISARERYQLIAWVTERERALLRGRAAEPLRQVPDVILLFHDAANHVRLRPGSSLTGRSVRARVFAGEADETPGAKHGDVEVRVGGEYLLRCPVTCERVDLVNGQQVATYAFVELPVEARARLNELLRG